MLRGARQVGKSSSVRELGKTFDFFLEINFENKEHQDAKKIFEQHSSPKGSIAEMFVGLEIVKNLPCNAPAQLFYWQREQRGSQAEIDYLIEDGTKTIPIEVKAGTRGAMQSLHQFIAEKDVKKGVRVSLENFGKIDDVEIYPIYATSKILQQ